MRVKESKLIFRKHVILDGLNERKQGREREREPCTRLQRATRGGTEGKLKTINFFAFVSLLFFTRALYSARLCYLREISVFMRHAVYGPASFEIQNGISDLILFMPHLSAVSDVTRPLFVRQWLHSDALVTTNDNSNVKGRYFSCQHVARIFSDRMKKDRQQNIIIREPSEDNNRVIIFQNLSRMNCTYSIQIARIFYLCYSPLAVIDIILTKSDRNVNLMCSKQARRCYFTHYENYTAKKLYRSSDRESRGYDYRLLIFVAA